MRTLKQARFRASAMFFALVALAACTVVPNPAPSVNSSPSPGQALGTTGAVVDSPSPSPVGAKLSVTGSGPISCVSNPHTPWASFGIFLDLATAEAWLPLLGDPGFPTEFTGVCTARVIEGPTAVPSSLGPGTYQFAAILVTLTDLPDPSPLHIQTIGDRVYCFAKGVVMPSTQLIRVDVRFTESVCKIRVSVK